MPIFRRKIDKSRKIGYIKMLESAPGQGIFPETPLQTGA
jgi:hypothetical protein